MRAMASVDGDAPPIDKFSDSAQPPGLGKLLRKYIVSIY